jgi:hypothetical protein
MTDTRLYHAVGNEWTEGQPVWSLYKLHDGDDDAIVAHAVRNWGDTLLTPETVTYVHMTTDLDEALDIAADQGRGRVLVIDPALLWQEPGLGDEGYPAVYEQINPEAIVDVVEVAR